MPTTGPWTIWNMWNYQEELREAEGGSPSPEETGDVTADVEHWCAVSANTKHPEEAFYIVDIMLSREFLSAMNFWNRQEASVDMPLLGDTAHGVIPVHTELLVNGKMRYRNNRLGLAQRQALAEAQENITFVYITSNFDRELDSLFADLCVRIDNGEALSDEDIRKATDKCHTTMKMMLAES